MGNPVARLASSVVLLAAGEPVWWGVNAKEKVSVATEKPEG